MLVVGVSEEATARGPVKSSYHSLVFQWFRCMHGWASDSDHLQVPEPLPSTAAYMAPVADIGLGLAVLSTM